MAQRGATRRTARSEGDQDKKSWNRGPGELFINKRRTRIVQVIYEQALSERNRSLHDRRDGLKETTQDHEAAFGFSSLSDFGHEITQNHSKQCNIASQ